jgi:hypothetical protein
MKEKTMQASEGMSPDVQLTPGAALRDISQP